jgi:hypothetical protein
MPEAPSEPPQLVASVSSDTGCFVRRIALASGSSLATSRTAVSTVFRIPPASWMFTTKGFRSGCPGAAMRCRSTITAAWFTSQPSPIRM